MNDIVLAVDERKGVRKYDALETPQSICGRHHSVPHIVEA